MNKSNLPTTMKERWDLLEQVSVMIANDFGPRPEGRDFNPFDPSDIARHGLVEIATAYKEFADVDNIAEALLAEHNLHGLDSDNLQLDEV